VDRVSPKVLALLALLTLVWGTNWPLFRIALDELPVLTFRSITMIVGTLMLTAILLLRGESFAVPKGKWPALIAASAMNILIWNIATSLAVLYIPSGHASVLAYTMPLWVALLGFVVSRSMGTLALLAALAIGAWAIGAHSATAPATAQSARATLSLPTSALAATVPEPTPTPTPLAPTSAPASIPNPTGYATFLTAPNDTLEQVASRMGSDPAAIAALNHIDPAMPLRADRPLVIPVYQAGEAGAGGLVIRRGNPAEPKVALTFDIEIDDKSLYAILEILNQRGIHGTFFVTGRWVQAYPGAARAIVQAGHEISNHSLTHPYFSRIGLDGAVSELRTTEQIIHDTTGVTARPYFRFPYGDFTADTVALVAREGYVAYHWSADDAAIPGWLDWAAQHPGEANGGILLLHGRSSTVDALPGWLDRLAARGLQPTTLTDTLR